MGRGDIKTKRGKRFASSYGKLRPRKVNANTSFKQVENKKITEVIPEKPKKKVVKKKSTQSKKPAPKK